jgi:hypothetical protein
MINWIVEKYMFEEYEEKLVQTIRNSGHNCLLVDDTDWRFDFDRDIKTKFKSDDCVFFYGSLQRGRQMLRDTAFIPGIFLTIDNYECYKYYGYYGDALVNGDYLIFGLNDIKEKIFNHLQTSSIFIRPSNGYKTFTGQLLSKDNFDEEFRVLCLSYGGLDLDQLVLVSKCQSIKEENRFVVINENGKNRIIDGNKYMVEREIVKQRIVDQDAWDYAETVINNYTPDKAFTIDIAKMSDGSYKVLEIGSFCCAGWYNMNLELVVNQINNLVINEYNDYYGLA